MSKWLNNETIIWENAVKPCLLLQFCPYGPLVEEFPCEKESNMRCEVFGHDCPVFYHAEPFVEGDGEYEVTQEDFDEFFKEIEEKMLGAKK